jgi:hypothetical protein
MPRRRLPRVAHPAASALLTKGAGAPSELRLLGWGFSYLWNEPSRHRPRALSRYHDFHVRSQKKRIEKLRYIHRNPVRRGLVEKPEDWPWSSFRHYATGVEGVVEIESEWTARKRERMGTPLHVKLVGNPIIFGTRDEKPHPSNRSSDGAPSFRAMRD